jgi:hypothetical protein
MAALAPRNLVGDCRINGLRSFVGYWSWIHSRLAPMLRGEVWWVNFDPSLGGEIQKTRPAVIVSNNASNRTLKNWKNEAYT